MVLDKISKIMVQGETEQAKNKYEIKPESAKNIISVINRFVENDRLKPINHPVFSLKKHRRAFRYAVFYFISKTRLIDLLPQKFLTGKFQLLQRETKPLHLEAYQYLKRKNGKVTMGQVNDGLKMFREKWPELNSDLNVQQKAFNTFEIEPRK
jgi:hypothetical protein